VVLALEEQVVVVHDIVDMTLCFFLGEEFEFAIFLFPIVYRNLLDRF
jgi:hypothetical protein